MVLIFLCVILSVTGASNGAHKIKEQSESSSSISVCLSETCTKESETIFQYINEQKKPCDNFHKFACGKFIDKKEKSKRVHGTADTFDIPNKDSIKLIKSYLVSEYSPDGGSLGIDLVKDLYKSCMNNATREAQGESLITRM